MNSRERVLTALDHKEPDQIPLDLGSGHACKFTKYFYEKLLTYFGLEEERGSLEICQKPYQLVYASDKVMDLLKCDVRNARVHYQQDYKGPYTKEWEEGDYNYYTSDLGTTYVMPKENGLYYDVAGCQLEDSEDEEEDKKFQWPKPNKVVPGSRKELEDYRAQGYLTTTCQVYANGFLQTGPLVYNYENWFVLLYSEPERCKAFIDQLYEHKLEWYDNIFEEYGGLFDVMAEADDFGTQSGTFCSPEMLREQIFPYHKKLVEYIKKAQPGIKMTLHTCGSVYHVISDIIEAGYDCLNPVQISAANMERERLKKEFGNDLVFWGGGMDTQHVLPHGTPEEVREETLRAMEVFGEGGGFVFSPVHNIQDDVPIENFITMWETFQENCKY